MDGSRNVSANRSAIRNNRTVVKDCCFSDALLPVCPTQDINGVPPTLDATLAVASNGVVRPAERRISPRVCGVILISGSVRREAQDVWDDDSQVQFVTFCTIINQPERVWNQIKTRIWSTNEPHFHLTLRLITTNLWIRLFMRPYPSQVSIGQNTRTRRNKKHTAQP